MKYLLFLMISFNLFAITQKPYPQKTQAEIMNEIYNTTGPSINVSLTATEVSTVVAPLELIEGAYISFSATNVGPTEQALITLSAGMRKASYANNSGGKFILLINSSAVGYIAPGGGDNMDFESNLGDIVGIKTITGTATVSSGELYFNFFN